VMLWADPSPVPSPIDVHVTVSFPPVNIPPPTVIPDPTLDNATLALASFTALLAAFTILLAVIGWRALRWQRKEIQHTEKQLELTQIQLRASRDQLQLDRQQAEDARQRARPQLVVKPSGNMYPLASWHLVYLYGSEPAMNVRLWLKLIVNNETREMGASMLYPLVAGSPPEQCNAEPLHGEDLQQGPFQELAQLPIAERASWAVVTWQDLDGTQHRWGCLHKADNIAGEPIWS
jgi:hypothetical protein